MPDTRTISTSLRLPADEYLRLKRAAEKAHVSVSDYIRQNVPGLTLSYRIRRTTLNTMIADR